jgi:diaminopimelate decarboxylase
VRARYENGSLHFGWGKSFDLAAAKLNYEEPSYYYDLDGIKHRYEVMRRSFSDRFTIHYAVKANSHVKILEQFAELGAGADTVSGGEIDSAIKAGINASKIIFSGVGKTKSEIEFAINQQIGQINVESVSELKRIEEIASRLGESINVALRMNPNVNPDTHPYITTGFRENKFGLEPEMLTQCFNIIKNSSHVHFCGLSMHIGSQLLGIESLLEAAEKMVSMAGYCERVGFKCDRLDFGGGVGIHYDYDQFESEELMMEDYAKQLEAKLSDFEGDFQLEPGRWLVAHSGVLLTQVQYLKKTEFKKFAIVDSGMHHLIRPALYQAYHRILPVEESATAPVELVDVVGPICESSDFLGKDRSLRGIKEGDLLAVLDAGAYGASMASNYNLHGLPHEYILKDGKVI